MNNNDNKISDREKLLLATREALVRLREMAYGTPESQSVVYATEALKKIANITDGHSINADRRDRIHQLANEGLAGLSKERDEARRQLEEAEGKLAAEQAKGILRTFRDRSTLPPENHPVWMTVGSLCSTPPSTALREHDLALAERAWKAAHLDKSSSRQEVDRVKEAWLSSNLYRELTKG